MSTTQIKRALVGIAIFRQCPPTVPDVDTAYVSALLDVLDHDIKALETLVYPKPAEPVTEISCLILQVPAAVMPFDILVTEDCFVSPDQMATKDMLNQVNGLPVEQGRYATEVLRYVAGGAHTFHGRLEDVVTAIATGKEEYDDVWYLFTGITPLHIKELAQLRAEAEVAKHTLDGLPPILTDWGKSAHDLARVAVKRYVDAVIEASNGVKKRATKNTRLRRATGTF